MEKKIIARVKFHFLDSVKDIVSLWSPDDKRNDVIVWRTIKDRAYLQNHVCQGYIYYIDFDTNNIIIDLLDQKRMTDRHPYYIQHDMTFSLGSYILATYRGKVK